VLTSVAFADGYCFDCTSVAHHDTPAVNTGHNNCAVLQYWAFSYDAVTTHSGSSSCVSSTDILCPGVGTGCFDCASLTAATYGTGIIDPNVAGACQCLPNFIWNAATNTCACPTSIGWTLTDSANPPTCTCPAPLATSLALQNYCVDCTLIPFNNGANTDYTLCTCLVPDNWAWDTYAHSGSCNCNHTY
jgi:hypothetical protein